MPAQTSVDLHPGALQVGVCSNLQQLGALVPDWQELLSHSPNPSMFLTPAWHIAWWRTYGGDKTPHVVALRDENARLVAVVPLLQYRDKLRGFPVRVLGSYNNDHASRTGMLVEPRHEAAAAQALARHLSSTAWQWDVILLRQLPADAIWLPLLIEACQQAGLTTFGPTPGVGKCVLPLTGTWDEFLAPKGHHFRSRLRENMRKVQKHGDVVYRRSAGSPEDFDVFTQLEEASWKSEDGYAKLGAAGWAFHRDIALASSEGFSCYNLFLELNGRVVGAMHAIGYAGTVYCLQTLFDESVRHIYPGRAQFAVHLQDMFADERFHLLDLNGNSPFCKSWSDTELPFVDLQMYGRQPYSWLLSTLKRVAGRNR